ncbi:MAG: hypothetical protein AVDCRST_MAG20-508, partial [uncultured Acidimicrobiales bacterium]
CSGAPSPVLQRPDHMSRCLSRRQPMRCCTWRTTSTSARRSPADESPLAVAPDVLVLAPGGRCSSAHSPSSRSSKPQERSRPSTRWCERGRPPFPSSQPSSSRRTLLDT